MTDTHTDRLWKIVGEQVTTIAGSSEEGSAAGVRFNQPFRIALDERGRL